MDYQALWEDYLGSIKNKELLSEAITHSSKTRDDENFASNERLEFLGDAVLKLAITKYLFDEYPNCQEGVLTKYRAKLISDKMLALLAKKLKLKSKMNFGSTLANTAIPNSVLSNAVESLIGCVFLDSDYQKAAEFVIKLWHADMKQAIDESIEHEYKTRLQELIQDKCKTLPNYQLISSSGPDHQKEFEMGVYLNDKLLAKAQAFSKKEASQVAAKNALENQSEWLEQVNA